MFNLQEYTTVRERIIEFWKRYPNGRIETEILEWSDKRFIVRAAIYRETTDQHPFATGLANEVISDKGVNKDFALENGATSAIGIACGNANIGVDKHKSSREEMKKVIETNKAKEPVSEGHKDYWTTPFGEQEESIKKVPAPTSMDQAVNTVAEILGTEKVVPSCKHGDMEFKDGNKNGRAWGGYFCRHMGVGGSEPKCPTKWYQLSSQGTWEPQKARA
jgi:hypothetical protein